VLSIGADTNCMSAHLRRRIADIIAPEGRSLGTARDYAVERPDGRPVFDARIVTDWGEIVWTGDLDLIHDQGKIARLCQQTNERLFVCQAGRERPHLAVAAWNHDGKRLPAPETQPMPTYEPQAVVTWWDEVARQQRPGTVVKTLASGRVLVEFDDQQREIEYYELRAMTACAV
jgi:hypothetical protein